MGSASGRLQGAAEAREGSKASCGERSCGGAQRTPGTAGWLLWEWRRGRDGPGSRGGIRAGPGVGTALFLGLAGLSRRGLLSRGAGGAAGPRRRGGAPGAREPGAWGWGRGKRTSESHREEEGREGGQRAGEEVGEGCGEEWTERAEAGRGEPGPPTPAPPDTAALGSQVVLRGRLPPGFWGWTQAWCGPKRVQSGKPRRRDTRPHYECTVNGETGRLFSLIQRDRLEMFQNLADTVNIITSGRVTDLNEFTA